MTNKNANLVKAIKVWYRSEAECAKTLGWTRSKLNRIVNGKTRISIDDAPKLAKAIRITQNKLLGMLRKD